MVSENFLDICWYSGFKGRYVKQTIYIDSQMFATLSKLLHSTVSVVSEDMTLEEWHRRDQTKMPCKAHWSTKQNSFLPSYIWIKRMVLFYYLWVDLQNHDCHKNTKAKPCIVSFQNELIFGDIVFYQWHIM